MPVIIGLSCILTVKWIWVYFSFKVRGPFVQTLCIEKESYMDAI